MRKGFIESVCSNDGPLSTLTANLSLVSFVLISKCQLWNRRKYSRWPLLFRGRACSSSSCGSNVRVGLLSSFVKSRNRHFNVDNFLPINGSFRRNNWSCLTYLSIFLSSSSKSFFKTDRKVNFETIFDTQIVRNLEYQDHGQQMFSFCRSKNKSIQRFEISQTYIISKATFINRIDAKRKWLFC